MSIKLAVAGRPQIVLDDENISLGSDPGCSVAFPDHADVKPKHAVIRSIAGRWLIEVRQAESVFIGTSDPKRMHWLTAGDVIRLTENGPSITFQPTTDGAASPQVRAAPPTEEMRPPAAPARARESDVILPPDSDELVLAAEPAPTAKSTASSKAKTKPLSSAIIPTLKSPPDDAQDTAKAPTSKTIRTTKPSSSAIIPTLKTPPKSASEASVAPLSTTIPTTKPSVPKATRTQPPSSTTIPTTKPPASKTIRTQPPSSTTINTQETSDAIPAVKKPKQPLSRTDAGSPAAKARRTKSGEISTFDPSITTEPDAKVPVLQRLSSWEIPIPPELAEEESEGAFGGRGRKSKKSQQEDIKFIKKIVISCAAFALGVLILYHGYRELRRALNGPGYGAPQTSMAVS